jgi:TonB family protein
MALANRRLRPALLLSILVSLLIPGGALAQEPPRQPPPQPPALLFGGVEPMMDAQKKIVDLLLAKKWRAARNLARAQFRVLAGRVGEHPGLAATALALEALADVGHGDEGPGICRWRVAQDLDVKLLVADLSAFGAAGELLKSHSIKLPPPGAASEPSQADREKLEKEAAVVQRPRITFGPAPDYTPAAREAHQEGQVIVELIIEKDGSVSNARILKPQPLGLDLSAVETVCGWRFKPATRQGEPVKVYYVVTMNFHVDKTPMMSF